MVKERIVENKNHLKKSQNLQLKINLKEKAKAVKILKTKEKKAIAIVKTNQKLIRKMGKIIVKMIKNLLRRKRNQKVKEKENT
jgi:hypothetical protein